MLAVIHCTNIVQTCFLEGELKRTVDKESMPKPNFFIIG